jgi:hypothetical protein
MKMKNMTAQHLKKSTGRSPLRLGLPRVQPIWIIRGFLLIPLALAWFALSSTARAVDPPPDGGYPIGNTAEGEDALFSLTTGADNTAIGFQALYSNTEGTANTAIGFHALFSNTTAGFFGGNTAVGRSALFSNTIGHSNTATGNYALYSNTSGGFNTATGDSALSSNTTGSNNTATGFDALISNTTGLDNTATGYQALTGNTEGYHNTANGFGALSSSTTGSSNTATGFDALNYNSNGGSNTANGDHALYLNTTGNNNTASGFQALYNNTAGRFNIALGFNAGGELTTGANNIDIGNVGVAGESNTIRIGKIATHKNTFIAGISGVTVAGGVGVIVDSSGHLGTVVSSERFKDEIKPMDKASEAILSLQPVMFRYKHELDPNGIPQFGLVAEQVEKVNPDLVARDEQGKLYTVRYEAVNAMLLNEFLKEHRKVESLEATIAQQQKDLQATVAQQQKQIETLTAGLQKVSGQVEMSKPASQMVLNNQ